MENPTWLITANITITLDARPVLATGNHPLEKVIAEAGSLNPGEIYEIITPFPPLPMIEKVAALGFDSFSEQKEDNLFHTFFCRL